MSSSIRRVLVLVLLSFALASCGRYFTAELSGYVKDSESEDGVDGAVIRIYEKEPSTADESGFIVETASANSGGNGGYYNHRIIWQNLFPAFGSEGDTNSVWLGITHHDYLSAIVEVRGLLSDTVNFVPDVLLDRAAFSVPTVTGRVVGPSGAGVNGVRVVLDVLSTSDTEDYVTGSTTIGGEAGRYEFTDVSWSDEDAAGSGTDTEAAELVIDDEAYTSSQVISIVLSADQTFDVSTAFSVNRIDATSFSTTLTGRCVNQYGAAPDVQNIAAQGIEVKCTFSDDDGAHTLYDQTNANGTYSFFIQWTDTTPGDFLEGTADSTIPVGEDGLIAEVTFADPNFSGLSFEGVTPGTYELPSSPPASGDDRQVKSWLDPNYAPDAIVVH